MVCRSAIASWYNELPRVVSYVCVFHSDLASGFVVSICSVSLWLFLSTRMDRVGSIVFLYTALTQLPQNRSSVYVGVQMRRFLEAYGRGRFDDVALYGRRLAETFCHMLLEELGILPEWAMLMEMMYALPDNLTGSPVMEYMYGDLRAVALDLGCHLTSSTVWNDLQWLQWYGNQGAHAPPYLHYGPLCAEEAVFLAALRILLVFVAYHRAFHGLRSAL